MKILFDEYGNTIINALISIFALFMIVIPFVDSALSINAKNLEGIINSPLLNLNRDVVLINSFEVDDCLIRVNEKFDYAQCVRATNTKGENIRSYVSLKDMPNIDKAGVYELIYLLRYNGETRAIKANLYVME